MTTKHKFKSDAFEAIHTSANALLNVGAIDKTTMRKFDDACLLAPHLFKRLLNADKSRLPKVGDADDSSHASPNG